jgi:hypothetical protein
MPMRAASLAAFLSGLALLLHRCTSCGIGGRTTQGTSQQSGPRPTQRSPRLSVSPAVQTLCHRAPNSIPPTTTAASTSSSVGRLRSSAMPCTPQIGLLGGHSIVILVYDGLVALAPPVFSCRWAGLPKPRPVASAIAEQGRAHSAPLDRKGNRAHHSEFPP